MSYVIKRENIWGKSPNTRYLTERGNWRTKGEAWDQLTEIKVYLSHAGARRRLKEILEDQRAKIRELNSKMPSGFRAQKTHCFYVDKL